jgi:lipid A 4'-phosphatase
MRTDEARAPMRWVLLAAFLACAAIFLAFPQIDLAFSALFYAPGTGFVLHESPAARTLEAELNLLPKLIVVVCALFLAASYVLRRWRRWRYGALFTMLLLALGAGLAVNFLKDSWGRARPAQIEQFGGTHRFTRAPYPAAQCGHNCSFTSGHAAIGFSLMAPAFFARRRRRAWMAAGLLAGAAVGLMRIAQGAHFLSDVVFSGWVVYAVALLIEAALLRIGYAQQQMAPEPANGQERDDRGGQR